MTPEGEGEGRGEGAGRGGRDHHGGERGAGPDHPPRPPGTGPVGPPHRSGVGRPASPEADVAEEIDFHLAERVRCLREAGRSEEEARAEALRRFGDPDRYRKRAVREDRLAARTSGLRNAVVTVLRDARYGFRSLRRAPAFAASVLLTLTLTIGATTAIVSVVNGVLFRPLPFPESDRLVAIWNDWTGRGGPEREWFSYPGLHDLREGVPALAAIGIYQGYSPTLVGDGGDPEQLTGAAIDRPMFAEVLRVAPAVGRHFTVEEDRPGAARTVILSHALWDRRFGRDPAVVGSVLDLGGAPATVVGVMPAGFQPPFAPQAEIWTALRFDATEFSGARGSIFLRALGRLAPDVTLEQARAQATTLGARLEQEYPGTNTGTTYSLTPLRDDLTQGARTNLLLLLGASVLVLLVGCLNVANLLLARTSIRGQELSVRTALGAGRRRLLGQLLTESLSLAAVGGALGVLLAFGITRALLRLAPPGTPRLDEVAVDPVVLLAATAMTVVAGLAFGVLPSLSGASRGEEAGLREESRGGMGRKGRRLREALVVGQVALALILLVGSGALLRSLHNLNQVELGYDPEGVLTFRVAFPQARYPGWEVLGAAQEELLEGLRALPGVTAAGLSSGVPLSGYATDGSFLVEGEPLPPPGQVPAVWYREVTPGYLEAMGIGLRSGRDLSPTDVSDSPWVVVVNQTFARRHFPGGEAEAVGRRLNFGRVDDPVWVEIVGVMDDQRSYGLREDGVRAEAVMPLAQTQAGSVVAVVRTSGPPETLIPAAREVVRAVDPNLAMSQIMPLGQLVGEAKAQDRYVAFLLSLFAGLALVLAAVGLFGVVSYGVSARNREFGLRMALGAEGGMLRRLVLRDSLVLVGVGSAVGLLGALLAGRLLTGLVYGVEPSDPITLGSVLVVLVTVGALSASIPAMKASRTDPVRSLAG